MTAAKTSWDRKRERLLADDPEAQALYERTSARHRLIAAVVAERTSRGWSQRDLARATGLQQPAVARFEDVDRNPSVDTVLRVCQALDLSIEVVPAPRRTRAS